MKRRRHVVARLSDVSQSGTLEDAHMADDLASEARRLIDRALLVKDDALARECIEEADRMLSYAGAIRKRRIKLLEAARSQTTRCAIPSFVVSLIMFIG